MSTAGQTIPQHMRSLALANDRRIASAALKRDLGAGRVSLAAALTDDRASGSLTLSELLRAQRRWGPLRTATFCESVGISENRRIRDLTDRERKLIARSR